MNEEPCSRVYDAHVFGEFGGVNPSIEDSSTFTFLSAETMKESFSREIPGCYLYSRHWNPSTKNLSKALAAMEGTEGALATASGMAAIACTLLQFCQAGDEIIASRTIYGGTYALLKNFLPRFGIRTHFVAFDDPESFRHLFNKRTKVLYGESISNPLLQVADIPTLADLAHEHDTVLVIDNTFSPLLLSPCRLGADVVVHSLTKYINGASDCMGGAICGSHDLIGALVDVNQGASMLLGPALDSLRAAQIWKNLHTLHIRMRQHSANALYLARELEVLGLKVHYPGLGSHPDHQRMRDASGGQYGYGGMLVLDVERAEVAEALMVAMQRAQVGLLAVSLGYFRTLFSAPGRSTSSEIPEDEQHEMGLSPGMIRMSIGLDPDIAQSFKRMKGCLEDLRLIRHRLVG